MLYKFKIQILEFNYLPTPNCIPNSLHPESKFSLTEQEAIDAEINDFLVKQVIEQSQPETGEIVSPMFLRPKKEPGVYRVIFQKISQVCMERFSVPVLCPSHGFDKKSSHLY